MIMSFALIILGELLSVCPALGVSQMFDVNMSVKPALLTHSLPKQGVWGLHCYSPPLPPLAALSCPMVFHAGAPGHEISWVWCKFRR